MGIFIGYICVCVLNYCCSVAKSCPTLCNPINYSRPDFPVLHCLLEFAQIHVHWVSDAIQPSYSLFPLLLLPSVFPSIRVWEVGEELASILLQMLGVIHPLDFSLCGGFSISSLVTGQYRFSVSSWFSLGRSSISRNISFSSKLSNLLA